MLVTVDVHATPPNNYAYVAVTDVARPARHAPHPSFVDHRRPRPDETIATVALYSRWRRFRYEYAPIIATVNRKNNTEKTVANEATRERRVCQVVPRHDDVI